MDRRPQRGRDERRAHVRRRRAARRRAGALLVLAALALAALLLWPQGHSRRPPAARPPSDRAVARHRPRHRPGHPRAPRRPRAIAPAHPGRARIVMHGAGKQVALTFDDGFCGPCVARTLAVLRRSGAHATIFPNGTYSSVWKPQAPTIRRMIASGQLTVGNHTFLHRDPRAENASAFQTDLSRDERWIEHTFGVTARPFFRPPYGSYNSETLRIAGHLGYTRVVLWSATVADSSPRSERYILNAIHQQGRAGAIVLMHGNYPATARALPRILRLLKDRGLRTVTLEEMLGRRR